MNTPVPTQAVAAERYALMDAAVRNYEGPVDELEAALGLYVVGHHLGWKVLHLMHSKKTIKKYEQILGIRLAEVFEPEGPDVARTNIHEAMTKISNFWKAVSGAEKIDMDRESKRTIL